MAIQNYGDLKGAIARWLANTSLTASIPDFVSLAESRIYDDARTTANEKTDTILLDAERVALPSDFIEQRSLSLETLDQSRLDYYPPGTFGDVRASYDYVGTPIVYTVESGELVLGPIPDSDGVNASLTYFNSFDALVNDEDTNALLLRYPGFFLYGSLIEAEPYLGDDPRALTWAAMYDETRTRAEKQHMRAAHPRGKRRTRGDVREASWR